MKIIVTGGTGFVGRALVEALTQRGSEVVVLTRGQADLPKGAIAVAWEPQRAGAWQGALDGAEAVIHLAGAPVAVRWNGATRRRILDSRVASAERLVEGVAEAARPPSIFVSASATGYYGADRPGESLTEESAPGDDFLAEVCLKWEAAAARARDHGARVVALRLGIVLGPGGGALTRMILPGRIGVGRVGRGDNYVSWIHRDDVVAMLLWSLDREASGAYNCTAPEPRTSAELAAAIARTIARPVVPAPLFALRLALGAAADVVAGSQRVLPRRALDEGFTFEHPRLEGALDAIFTPR